MQRRHMLGWAAGTLSAAFADANAQQPALPLLRIYIPGGAGGGWDQTGRTLGAAIQAAGLAQRVEYQNKGGKGGTIGLAEFVDQYSRDPAALLIGGMVMVGAIAVNQSAATLAQVNPIARLTSDYMVLVTPRESEFKDMAALVATMQRNLATVTFTGGSVGSVDHMLAGMIARQLRLDVGALRYQPTTSGNEAVALLASGKAQVAISSLSEFKAGIENKTLVPLAVSSRRAIFGVPSLTDQGIATDLANWRGVFGPAGISAAQSEALRHIVVRATEGALWRQALVANNWVGAVLTGKDFRDVLEIEQAIARAVVLMLKLKA